LIILRESIGLDREHTIGIQNARDYGEADELIAALEEMPAVEKMAFGYSLLPTIDGKIAFSEIKNPEQIYIMAAILGDENLFSVYDIKLLQGRPLAKYDSLAFLVNETAANQFDLKVGTALFNGTNTRDTFSVAGIVQDFRFDKFQNSIEPLLIAFDRHADLLLVRFKGEEQDFIRLLEVMWARKNKVAAPSIITLKKGYDALLANEERLLSLMVLLALVLMLYAKYWVAQQCKLFFL